MNKTGKILLMLIVFISAFSVAQAQRGDRKRSPEDAAKRTSKLMKDSLALSDAQMVKIDEVNLSMLKKCLMQELKQEQTLMAIIQTSVR